MQLFQFLHDKKFHEFLLHIDYNLANNVLDAGCQYCEGNLHVGDYPRKPHGLTSQFRDIYAERLSFCCAKCKKRNTPPSVRFFGRYWYVAPVLLLISALTRPINDKLIEKIYHFFGIHVFKSTIKRWRQWWGGIFASSTFWRQSKGVLPGTIVDITLPIPRMLMRFYGKVTRQSLLDLLKLITPISYGFHRII
jgi:hypothetical protein